MKSPEAADNTWSSQNKKAAAKPALRARTRHFSLIQWFRDMKIQYKLLCGFGVLVMILIVMTAFTSIYMYRIDKTYSSIITSAIGRQSSIAKAVSDMEQIYYINLSKGYLAAMDSDPGRMEVLHAGFNSYTQSFREHLNEYYVYTATDENLTDHERQERLGSVNEVLYLYDNMYYQLVEQLDAALYGDVDEVYRITAESMLVGDQIAQKMNMLYNLVTTTAEEISQDTTSGSYQTIQIMYSGALFLILLSIIFSLFMTSKIKAPILQMENAMLEIAKGDLTYPIRSDSNDELGVLANKIGDMVDGLHKTQVELQMALNAAEDSLKIKNEILDNMSHELRTPMNGLLGYHRMALRTNLTHEQREYITEAENSARKLLGIIDDILDFTDVINAKILMNSSQFRLVDVFNELDEIYSPAAAAKDIVLNMHLAPELPEYVTGDSYKVHKILSCLVDNAVKFTERGKVTVRANVTQLTDSHVEVCFYVRDTGVGIKPEHMQFLFDPFWQADTSLTRKYGGTGFGLPLSKNLAGLIGGKIWAESEYDEGSVFYFSIRFGLNGVAYTDNDKNRLPKPAEDESIKDPQTDRETVESAPVENEPVENVQTESAPVESVQTESAPVESAPVVDERPEPEPEQKPEPEPEPEQKPEQKPEPEGQTAVEPEMSGPVQVTQQQTQVEKKHLLVVDDMEINQIIAEEFLTGMGYSVDVACNGQEALDMLALKRYDAVLMDIQMPVMDGLTATKKIKESGKYKGLPIIAVSAHAMKEDIEKSRAHGLNDHITKPLDMDILAATLDKWLNSAGS